MGDTISYKLLLSEAHLTKYVQIKRYIKYKYTTDTGQRNQTFTVTGLITITPLKKRKSTDSNQYYRKILNIGIPKNNHRNSPKHGTAWFYKAVAKRFRRNSKQCRPWSDCSSRTAWYESALSAQTYLSLYIEFLWYNGMKRMKPNPVAYPTENETQERTPVSGYLKKPGSL